MIKRLPSTLFACGTLCMAAPDSPANTPAPSDTGAPRHGTITEKTPSIPQYFTWINNTNEGATEEQTLVNLRFFKWLHDEFGMRLGIYAFDAGAIDSQQYYGRMDSERFRKQFPDGFKEIAELARSFDCRLGMWGGPDGFGDMPQEEAARTEMLLSLCRDYGFQLFKFDSVCGQLRDHKQQAFMNTMTGCRQHAPDLVVLNHRLNLSEDAKRHVTTYLWEGAETYIDVHMINQGTATHNRAGALARGLPPGLGRLTEDCGVCLSSCLDFWEDDLVLQAFNRSLILAPELYGNPWLLRDDEFPKLARLFNLHFRNRGILVEGMTLPASYGKHAVARGDARTRFITLRNLGWNPIKINVRLGGEIGLTSKGRVELRQYHPSEQMLGTFEYGDSVPVTVDSFRACLLMATVKPCEEIGVIGCRYEIVRDTPDKPVKVKLLGSPGTTSKVKLHSGSRPFREARVNGRSIPGVLGEGVEISFPGTKADASPHRKLADLQPVPVPADAEALYEATCFTAPNDALEVQSLRRSGPSNITPVKEARDAFLNQALFWRRGIWDKYLFDRRDETFLSTFVYESDKRIAGGCLRVDLGTTLEADTFRIRTLHDPRNGKPIPAEMPAEIGTTLDKWHPVVFKPVEPATCQRIAVAEITKNGGQHELHDHDLRHWEAKVPEGTACRYLRLAPAPDRTAEVGLWRKGKQLEIPATSRATALFAPYDKARAELAWQAKVSLPSHPAPNSYLCVALNGEHGRSGAYAALRMDGQWIGAPQRAVSYPAVVFEYPPRSPSSNFTYFFPVTQEMHGRNIEVVVLGLEGCDPALKPEVWTTTYPHPYESLEMVLE
ncbi:MAG: hypothetical protein HS113_04375 [Verrucomicrobiales bacterium]|nr:hypothetical protein [Verrucomicrobiales bacterium]